MKSAKNEFGNKTPFILAVIFLSTALVEVSMGRRLWGTGGVPGLWSGDIWSEHNSQFLADPYTFTHVCHGILLFAIVTWRVREWPTGARLCLAAALEGGWEILENTAFIINRYRAETVSLNYFGDSIVNSMGDILACTVGFILASRLPRRSTIGLLIGFEILLLLWTRDNLTLNIVMLIHPSQVIRAWQLGR